MGSEVKAVSFLNRHYTPPITCNSLTRRQFEGVVLVIRLASLLSEADSFSQASAAPQIGDPHTNFKVEKIKGKTQKPIVIFNQQGGQSKIDTWDPKPDTPEDIRGPFKTIKTNVPGLHFTELLPNLAHLASKLTIVKGVYHDQEEHGRATALTFTGNPDLVNNKGDSLFNRPREHYNHRFVQLTRQQCGPYFVLNGNAERETYGGVQKEDGLHIRCDFKNGDSYNPSAIISAEDIPPERIDGRLDLLKALDIKYLDKAEREKIDQFYEIARKIAGDLNLSFDLTKIPDRIRERYGRDPFGNAAVIVSNLVKLAHKKGIPAVFVLNTGFWDDHWNIQENHGKLGLSFDRAAAAFTEDCREFCTIAFTDEFSRDPRITRGGREHWSHANTMIFSDPDITPKVLGKTDKYGAYPVQNKGVFYGGEFGATVARVAGYALHKIESGTVTKENLPYWKEVLS